TYDFSSYCILRRTVISPTLGISTFTVSFISSVLKDSSSSSICTLSLHDALPIFLHLPSCREPGTAASSGEVLTPDLHCSRFTACWRQMVGVVTAGALRRA